MSEALITLLVPGVDPAAVDLRGIDDQLLAVAARWADPGALLADPGPVGAATRTLLDRARTTRWADPEWWPELGYRQLPPGARWPDRVPGPPPTVPLARAADDYDVVVVGAGAGGGVAAHVLSAAGLRVLLLEGGPNTARSDLPHDVLRNARVNTGLQRQLDPPWRTAPRIVAGELTDSRAGDWGGNAFAVGGGTRVYGAQAWRFSPEDFAMGSTYGPAFPDWPIDYADLEPWYEIVEQRLGVSGPAGPRPHDGPRRRTLPMPPFEPTAVDHLLRRGAAALDLEAAPVPLLINTVPYNGRPGCLRCGTCVGFACHNESRTGTHTTVVPWAVATGRTDLVAGAVVRRLLTDHRGTVTGVEVAAGGDPGRDPGPGGPRLIRARHTVLAAGAVETARLLLLSGVGTAHDQVGRYLQGHPYRGAVGLFREVVQDCNGPGATTSTTQYRHHNPGIAGGGILANEFVPSPVEFGQKAVAAGLVPPWGDGLDGAMTRAYPHTAWIVGPQQQVPDAASRVTLSGTVRDARGVPAAELSATGLHPLDAAGGEFLLARAADWLRAAGAHTVAAVPGPAGPTVSAGQHQAGTARMGTDPATSVTDSRGRVWGHDGVTVADASLHVTNGGVNPVLTVLALAWRISDGLAHDLRP